ncbi:MAG TPA: YetF domain-containing protein [Burkholderiales bacterium]|nr:YetF domain-containing protein [Burkholderiales bacterium]
MSVDWAELFRFSVSPAELIVRGTAMYLFLLVLFRVVIKRRVGTIGMADLLVLVIIADAAQNAMAGEYRSVTDGFVLVGTIVGWNHLLDWVGWRFPAMRRLLEPAPLLLIDRGRVLWKHLRIEFVSEDELKAKLRESGVTDPKEVDKAYLEADGQVTVIRREPASSPR